MSNPGSHEEQARNLADLLKELRTCYVRRLRQIQLRQAAQIAEELESFVTIEELRLDSTK
jgi:hypothetical protein